MDALEALSLTAEREKRLALEIEQLLFADAGTGSRISAGYISEHDRLIGRKLARILTGGAAASGSRVSEQQLLDLEREAFLSLCGERKSLERIQFMLKKGKPLRN